MKQETCRSTISQDNAVSFMINTLTYICYILYKAYLRQFRIPGQYAQETVVQFEFSTTNTKF